MEREHDAGHGAFELIDPKLTIYALANGMDLAKDADVRRLGWYREGREREIRIASTESGGFSLTAAAWKTSTPEMRTDAPLGDADTVGELLERLTGLLNDGQTRANEL